MHTFSYWDESFGPCDNVKIHYNGDFSGNAIISKNEGSSQKIEIPCETLLEFAAKYVRMKRIGELEDADWKDILK